MLKKIASGVIAGICISMGGAVFLACDNKVVGAIFFSVALICICMLGYTLYTGKAGYLVNKCGKEELSVAFLGLLGNLIGTVACGYYIRYAVPSIGKTAETVCNAKLDGQNFVQTLVRAIFCCVLVYLAVEIYKEKKSVIGIIFCIPVFILAGFEHSIADMFYFAASGIVSLKAFGFIWTVILGNTIGAMLIPLLQKIGNKKDDEK